MFDEWINHEAAADALLTPTSGRQRLVVGRIQSLTAKASQQAGASSAYRADGVTPQSRGSLSTGRHATGRAGSPTEPTSSPIQGKEKKIRKGASARVDAL